MRRVNQRPLFYRYLALYRNPLFLAGYISVIVLCYLFWDRPLAIFLHQCNFGFAAPYLHYLTHLGLGSYSLILFSCLFLLFRYFYYDAFKARQSLFLLLSVFSAGVVCDILKVVMARARPDQLFDHNLYGFYLFKMSATFWSFPSGHTTVITAVTVGLSCLKPRYWLLLLITNLIIVSTRVLLTYHYISDVLAASLLTHCVVGYLYQNWPVEIFNNLTHSTEPML